MRLIQLFFSIPLPLRLVLLFLGGACVGAAVNLGIYRLAYLRRRIGPWSRTRGLIADRNTFDRIPILGWLSLKRESPIHGRGFWIRPMLLELCFALGTAALYWWEIPKHALLVTHNLPDNALLDMNGFALMHWQFFTHVFLLALLAVATFIDFDEQTIPDAVTVPGTIIALLLAAFCPAGSLPWLEESRQGENVTYLLQPLRFDFPVQATAFLAGIESLIVALAGYLIWCGGLLPRRWRRSVGVNKAWRVMWRRIGSRTEWQWILLLAVLGCAEIVLLWLHGGERWRALCSAVIGLTVGGGIIWIIRFISSLVLQREAMGFGDVTLMAMIGAFFGWQAVLIVFFLSPFAGAVVGIVQWVIIRDNVIPFGPFLCLAALVVLLFWGPIWDHFGAMFEVPWLVPSAIAVCLPLMALLLVGIKMLRGKAARA